MLVLLMQAGFYSHEKQFRIHMVTKFVNIEQEDIYGDSDVN